MTNGTLINVCGTGYCGSTLLDLLLGNGSSAFSCGEVWAWFRPFRRHHFTIDCSCGQDPCPIWREIGHVPESEFHITVISILEKEFVIDSSKDLSWVIDNNRWATSENLDVYNLVIWKDPLKLAYSYWKRGYRPLKFRSSFIKYHRRLIQSGLNFFSVNYDDLIDNLIDRLQDICMVIDMDYFPGKERFWEGDHHYLFGSGSIREQISAGNAIITKTREYSEEFQNLLPAINIRIEKDRKVQEIVKELEKMDVRNFEGFEFPEYFPPNIFAFPSWYYLRKIKGCIRRIFPQKKL